MSSKLIPTGPQRLRLVGDKNKFVGGCEENYVSFNELCKCLQNIAIGIGYYDLVLDIDSVVKNYLMPYSVVIPQQLRLLTNSSTAFEVKHCKPEHLAEVAVSEGFAMDVMRAITRNCFAFAVMDGTHGAPKGNLVALQKNSSDANGPVHVVSMENLKR